MEAPKLNDIFKHTFSFTNDQVEDYAKISGDINPVHIDEQYGNNSEFGKCIVHGYFTNSVFSKVYGTLLYAEGHILVEQETKYIKPVLTNVTYLAVFTVIKLIPEKNRVVYLNEIFDAQTGDIKVTGKATLMNRKLYNW